MKKRRIWALIMLPLLLAACAPAGEAGTTEISCPTAEEPAPDTLPGPEHPFTADTDLSAALGDYPGLLQLYAAPGATLVGPAGYYRAAEEERLDLLYDRLSPGSPVEYYVAYRRLEEESEAANTALFENAVFDTSGRCVSGYDKTDILLLAGDILVRGDYGGKKMDPSRILPTAPSLSTSAPAKSSGRPGGVWCGRLTKTT